MALRTKLIASFVLVIFLSLFSAGTAFVFQLRDYQIQLSKERVSRLVGPITTRIRDLSGEVSSPSEVLPSLRDQANAANMPILDVRILLVERSGLVIEDTQKDLMGQRIDTPLKVPWDLRLNAYWGTQHIKDEDVFLVTIASFWNAVSRLESTPPYTPVLIVEQRNLAAAWMELLPSLMAAGLISLAISLIGAFFLSQSISRPLAGLTRASEEMAQGKYDQSIEVRGKDEIARLASTFNAMSKEVSRSQHMLRDFLANVSHQLKTPLTSIQGFSQAMLDGAVTQPEEYNKSAKIINDEATRMRILVDDLLRLSRIETGDIAMVKRELALGEILRSCVERLEPSVRQGTIQLVSEVDELPSVMGNAHWLENAFGELLDNAVKHTPRNGRITIKATRNGTNGSRQDESVHVSVINSGSFIPPGDLTRVFERFYQVAKSPTIGGTGLGLAIAKEVVQAHGGSISVKSDPENGTEFTVSLPGVNGHK